MPLENFVPSPGAATAQIRGLIDQAATHREGLDPWFGRMSDGARALLAYHAFERLVDAAIAERTAA